MSISRAGYSHFSFSTQDYSGSDVVPSSDFAIAAISGYDNNSSWLELSPTVKINTSGFTNLMVDNQDLIEHMWMGYLINPDEGSQSLYVYTDSAYATIGYGVNLIIIYFSGIDQGTAIRDYGESSATGSGSNGNDISGLSYSTGDMTVGFGCSYNDPDQAFDDNGQTEIYVSSEYRGDELGCGEKLNSSSFETTGGTYQKVMAAVLAMAAAGGGLGMEIAMHHFTKNIGN